ncbi:unnamed protein product [Trichobilharzia regenti]|nr:unnamed protein product [Trichobilharzia regenti]
MIWYKDELLKMAIDIGNRLLPAFDTPTGIPYPRINLRYGSSGLKKQEFRRSSLKFKQYRIEEVEVGSKEDKHTMLTVTETIRHG